MQSLNPSILLITPAFISGKCPREISQPAGITYFMCMASNRQNNLTSHVVTADSCIRNLKCMWNYTYASVAKLLPTVEHHFTWEFYCTLAQNRTLTTMLDGLADWHWSAILFARMFSCIERFHESECLLVSSGYLNSGLFLLMQQKYNFHEYWHSFRVIATRQSSINDTHT